MIDQNEKLQGNLGRCCNVSPGCSFLRNTSLRTLIRNRASLKSPMLENLNYDIARKIFQWRSTISPRRCSRLPPDILRYIQWRSGNLIAPESSIELPYQSQKSRTEKAYLQRINKIYASLLDKHKKLGSLDLRYLQCPLIWI